MEPAGIFPLHDFRFPNHDALDPVRNLKEIVSDKAQSDLGASPD